MRTWLAPAIATLLVLGGCRSRDTVPIQEPAPAPVSIEEPAPAPAPSTATAKPAPPGSARPMTGLPITLVKPEVAKFALGDAAGARIGPHGWMATKRGTTKEASDLVFAASTDAGAPKTIRAPRSGQPHFVSTRTKAFAWYEEHDGVGAQLFSLDNARARLVQGALPGEWAFDLSDGRTLLVGTRGGKMMIASHWHVSVLGPDGPRVVSSATTNESAWGAAAFGDGFVVAVREPITMAGATQDQRATAILSVLDGDGGAAEQLSEPARGALLYLDKEGRVTRREAIGPQRPSGLATTDHGWLVVLGEGTLRGGLRDAVLMARAPNEPAFRVLASELDTPFGLRQRGGWSCLTELPSKDGGKTYVVHCVDPERGLHVATPPIEGIVSVNDIELGRPTRVWLSSYRYGKSEDVLTIPLP